MVLPSLNPNSPKCNNKLYDCILMCPDQTWLKSQHPHLYDRALVLWKESVFHQMFDRPVPWKSIRVNLEDFNARQENLQKEIEAERYKQGDAYKGGGLLQLCVAGSADWYLAVEYVMKKDVSFSTT